MKYITLIIGLLVVGCGEVENGAYKHRPKQADTNESTPTTNTNEVSGTTEKPDKELTLREKAIGTYELKYDEYTFRGVFLENGVSEWYDRGKKVSEFKWSIVDGEIHNTGASGSIVILRINPDKSITYIADIRDGKREDLSKKRQDTYIKIK